MSAPGSCRSRSRPSAGRWHSQAWASTGVVAFGVARRTREIGARVALGAGGPRVMGEVLRSGLSLALPELVVGGVLAALVATALSRLNALLGTAPADLAIMLAVADLLAGVVELASSVPARRASRVPTSEALRAE